MRIVIDANRIVAALIKQSTTREIILDGLFEFVTPDFVLYEIKKHRNELQKKTKLTEKEFNVLLILIFEQIIILPKSSYLKFIDDCKNYVIDINDVPYLAACIASKATGIWSHDPHILKQKKVRVFTNINMLDLSKSPRANGHTQN